MNIQTLQQLKSRKSSILKQLRENPFGKTEKLSKELATIDREIEAGAPTVEDLYATIARSSTKDEPKADALTILRIDLGHTDAFPSYKTRVRTPAGTLGITHRPGDKRFGSPMMASYGHLLGSYGKAEDRKAWDFYLGDEPDNEDLYEVLQTTEAGMPDERKFISHCRDMDHAREVFVSHAGQNRFGYIRPTGWDFFE